MNHMSSLVRRLSKSTGCCSMTSRSSKVLVLFVLLACLWSEVLLGHLELLFSVASNNSVTSTTYYYSQARFTSTSATTSRHDHSHVASCRPPTLESTSNTQRNQPKRLQPKVNLNATRMLALGGYERISKGSGVIPQAGPLLMLLSQLQLQNLSLSGTVAEIGVHHGRFTSFLFVTARQSEHLVVADLFEDLQEFNVDLSGSGNKQRFIEGMATYGLQDRELHTIYTGSSTNLPLDWRVHAGFRPFRLISVDGGHTAQVALHDLHLAFCNLLPGGIVVLDDFFHGAWPGVTQAFFEFVHNKPSSQIENVYPFLVCKSKLFLTNTQQAHVLYYKGLLQQHATNEIVRPFAHEKARGSVKYELNGVPYLTCKTQIDVDEVHQLWAHLAF